VIINRTVKDNFAWIHSDVYLAVKKLCGLWMIVYKGDNNQSVTTMHTL